MTPQQKLTELQTQVADLRRRLDQADHNLEEYRRVMEQATESLKKAKERIEELEALLTGERWTDPKQTQPEHAADAKALAEVLRIVEAKP